MNGIVTVTVDITSLSADQKAQLQTELAGLGLRTTLPSGEGGMLTLPSGTYGSLITVQEQMAQLKTYYQGLVDIMRKLDIRGAYFVNVSQEPTFVCGRL